MDALVPDIDSTVTNGATAAANTMDTFQMKDLSTMEGSDTQLHLIDEDKQFSGELANFIQHKWHLNDAGFNYHLAAVFGSQSTGKSTLLNRLFGTHFDVMSESARRQTTKGIWISRGKGMRVLVMDVEGTDGRERGEDQDFERKSALFSLATSEVLIVNMWEHQVGLYNGANMGLLKTVFEVNLQLFGGNRGKEKTLLFFVIRDHVGATPLTNLANTLLADLDRIWQSLSKPEGLEDCRITDYFAFDFTALPHKLLQPEKFEEEVGKLRLRFSSPSDPEYVFQPPYSKRIPADGLHIYASGIWEKIMTNKDLDLPTQQELLAQFRCDEIANVAFGQFFEAIKSFRHTIEAGTVINELGSVVKKARDEAMISFDKDASRYHSEVYKRKRVELLNKLHSTLEPYFVGQLKNLHKAALALCTTQLQQAFSRKDDSQAIDFSVVSKKAKDEALDLFITGAKAIRLDQTEWEYEEEQFQLERDLLELANQQREKELTKMLTLLEKHLKREMDEPIKLALDQPGPNMWGRVIDTYKTTLDEAQVMLRKKSQVFDLEEEKLTLMEENLRRQAWVLMTMKVQEESIEGLIVYKLLNRFEEQFQRDERGLPRVWKPSDDIDAPFRKARNEDPLTGTKFVLESTDDFDFEQSLKVLSETRQQEIGNQLRRKADATFVEAKRSIVATQAKVPYWVGVALVVLGWNEFMAVITSPVYLSMTAMVGVPMAALWYLGMLGMVQTVIWKVYEQTADFGRERLRDMVLEQPVLASPPQQWDRPQLPPRVGTGASTSSGLERHSSGLSQPQLRRSSRSEDREEERSNGEFEMGDLGETKKTL
ncbi:Dynamin-like GTPase that mediates homotypic ER fusion [Lunasporangiospora selenospora]|uniref:Dynamin-like GTPase that mediates homotypic ER fusion n=1 Tax=Lunasporangiospora selenospora TaxID=979761 RepID=A0A9P6G0B1_9FUNG|nr:Dynamin-like GTPase that mediates homotypic ER fusion [Lunasporangiospora selenospora]